MGQFTKFFVFLLVILAITAINAVPLKKRGSKPVKPVDMSGILKQLSSTLKSKPEQKDVFCDVCNNLVTVLRDLIENNVAEEILDNFLEGACIALNIIQNYTCHEIIVSYGNELYFVLERTIFTTNQICGLFEPSCGTPNSLEQPWSIILPEKKITTTNPWAAPVNPKKTIKALHLSDIHIDRWYVEGAEAKCSDHILLKDYALCCRDYSNTDSKTKFNSTVPVQVPAGKWGSPYTCDIPFAFFDYSMNQIAQNHADIDYIIITGDMASHAIWDYTQQSHIENINNITATLLKYFKNIPIYQSIGNHEGVPMDAMAPHTMEDYADRGPTWLYDLLAKDWLNWLPYSAKEGIQYRASYAVRPFPGLKFISINTVYCSHFNFYLYINETDPDYTMHWMINELYDSEMRGEKVHLASHIPPGSNYCLTTWTQNWYAIVERFKDTIAGQFFGHTHNDHFQVYYEDEDPNKTPIHFNFISPSLTTYAFLNPAYRIYTLDGNYSGSTFTVVKTETYYTNLTENNLPGNFPNYMLEYTLPDDYGMKDLSPKSWGDLINTMKTNDTIFQKYYNYYNRVPGTCTGQCKIEYLCEARSAEVGKSDVFCADLKNLTM